MAIMIRRVPTMAGEGQIKKTIEVVEWPFICVGGTATAETPDEITARLLRLVVDTADTSYDVSIVDEDSSIKLLDLTGQSGAIDVAIPFTDGSNYFLGPPVQSKLTLVIANADATRTGTVYLFVETR